MSRSSTATAPKPASQLSLKSAWSKGPPQTTSAPSPRSQSPAPSNVPSQVHPSHSRRPSTLGQGVNIKDGVSIPRSNVEAVKQGSSVTFGTINDVSAPISSSPAAVPAIKSEGVKSFGSVPANGPINGKPSISSIPSSASSSTSSKPSGSFSSTSSITSAASTPPVSTPSTPAKPFKMDIHKFFQNPGSSSTPSQPSSDTASPSTRPSNLPPLQQSHQQHSSQPGQPPPPPPSQPSQLGNHGFTPFTPSGGLRPQQQNTGPGSGPSSGPRSPNFPRPMPNGSSPRPSGTPSGPPAGPSPMSAGMPSPRLQPHAHPTQASGMPPQMPVQGWGYYYDPYNPYGASWSHYMPPMPHPHPHQQHAPPPPPPGSLGPPPHTGMPMSPRNPPISLQPSGPGTPTLPHAVPAHSPIPPPITHAPSNSISGVSSPPPTPSTSSVPSGPRLNTGAAAFVPGRTTSKVSIKSADGTEVKLENLKKSSPGPGASSPAAATPPAGFGSPSNRRSVRLESEDARKKRIAEEQEKLEKAKEQERLKAEAEEKARKEKAEKERQEREAEKKKREEEEARQRLLREEEERKLREEEERKRKEEEERRRKKEEEKERLRKEEEERKREEEAEEERKRKEEDMRRLEEERIRKEEEEKVAKAKAEAEEAEIKAKAQEEVEDGEVVETEQDEGQEITIPAEPLKNESPQKQPLRIDTSAAQTETVRRRPGPLDLSNTSRAQVGAPLPSALATARVIDDLGRVPYPEGVKSPSVELNVNAKNGKFRYDREFLLQFMQICKEKPDMLPPLDAIGLEPTDQTFTMTRGGSGRHRPSSGPSATPSRQASTGLNFNPISGFGKPGPANAFNMGNFATPATKMSSEDRFAMSTSRSASGPAGLAFGRPAQMQRTASQGGAGMPMGDKRTRSKRGEKRNDANKVNAAGAQQGHGSAFGAGPSGAGQSNAPTFEPVAPLKQSANRWDRKIMATIDPDSPEVVDRKVKALLNKLTMEKFDSISDQIIEWANKSEKEKDGRTLIQVIRLVFEKATDEATWSEMYARLCRKMMEQISPKVQDDGIKNPEGKPIAGGQLFRKYLLNRCQEDFERGWVNKEATAAAAATKAMEDQAAKAANETSGGEEVALYSDEYYAAQKAKRQGLGLIKFIGELFKLQMLTERIMHECVKKLLGNVDNPEEEEIESLCKLLTTVGALLDVPKARAHMDVYFSRMRELTKSLNVSPRMQFMLQDVIELRERKWVSRNLVAAPTTIAQIHEAAAKEKAAAEKEAYQRQLSMSRGGSKRGGDRADFTGPDGWTVTGGSAPRPQPKAGDLSQFGKINKSSTMMPFGPSSIFAGKKGQDNKREPIPRTSSNSNMFSMLSQNPEATSETAASRSSRPPSRKASIDLSQSGAPEPPRERRKLVLAPRSKPVEESQPSTLELDDSGHNSEDEHPDEQMTEADALKKIKEDVKEFFAVRNLDEAEVYFTKLPSQHHFHLVDKLVSQAIESKEVDAKLVADLFSRANSKSLCSSVSFEEGFTPITEIWEDIVIDVPKAWNLMAIMLKGANLEEEVQGRVASKTTDSDKLLALLS